MCETYIRQRLEILTLTPVVKDELGQTNPYQRNKKVNDQCKHDQITVIISPLTVSTSKRITLT